MNTEALIRSAKRRVLVVEDEEINREILGMILEDRYSVLYAENGQVALDRLRAEPGIAMILLDINMPVMNGYAFMEALHADSRIAAIPVIVLTSDKEAELEALQRGAMDFIPKPYDMPEVILARVKRIIEFTEDRRIITEVERDPLTGLYDRNFFCEYCATLLNEHKDKQLDMIAVNVDRFRLINEIYGRNFGDQVLCAIADDILDLLDSRFGISCRSNADLFYILIEHDDDYEGLADALSDKLRVLKGQRNARLRIGIFQNVDTSHPVDWFCDAARAAANSNRGKFNRSISFYDRAMNEKEHYQGRLVQDFDIALRDKHFQIYFQPKYRVQGEKPALAGAEALVRWVHPELGFISPGQFIPVFEDNGLITRLDSYVWNEAAASIHRWKQEYGWCPPISVNLSRQDLFDMSLLERMQAIVRDNGITCEDLPVEVTESAYAQDTDHMLRMVADLREAGFHIEMDDFGSGYSSLNMLCLMPIDTLKIDMNFVHNMLHAGSGYSILEFVIDLAHRMKLPTVVEGVENHEQYEMVKQAGCDLIQGYYFSKPLPGDAFEELLKG